MITLKELADREYISFSGKHPEKEMEMRKIWGESKDKFRALGDQMVDIRSDAEAIKEVMYDLGYKAWSDENKLPLHYLRRGRETTELVTDHSITTEEKGVHIYSVRNDGFDELIAGKIPLSLWDAAATVVVTYAGTSAAMYFVDGPENTQIALAGLSALMGLFVAGASVIEKRRMRPTLLYAGTDEQPNRALLELMEQ